MTCVLCHAPLTTVCLEGVPDYLTGEQFAIRQCPQCGLAATAPRVLELERFYPAEYRRYGRVTASLLQWLFRRRVHQWASRFRTPGRVLEVGCGDGWMLAMLQDRGWRVLGCERSAEAARAAAEASGIPVVVGGLEQCADGEPFDLIILFQVLEHMTEPMDTLRRCASLLRPGGMLVVAVPNFASWQARLTGRSWFHLDVPRHQHHFSPAALTTALETAGLQVVHTAWVSPEHDPFGWFQSLLNKAGMEHNLAAKFLIGVDRRPGRWRTPLMLALVGTILVPASIVLSLVSWMSGAGAIVEKWAVKPEPAA